MNPNFAPYGAINSEFIAKNLQEKERGRQFTDSSSGCSHTINIYYFCCVSSVKVFVPLYSSNVKSEYSCLVCRVLSLTDQSSKFTLFYLGVSEIVI